MNLEDRAVPAVISGIVFTDLNNNGAQDFGEFGIAGQQVFLDTNNNGKFDAGMQMGPTLFASTDVPVAIPDNNLTGITSKNIVAGTGTIVDIDVSVNISHTWIGDLTITIIAPGGQSIVLYQPQFDPDGDDMIVTFDDESLNGVIPNTPPNATPPAYNLDYQPQNKLSGLDGLLADGEWNLKCSDSVGFDTGTINSWSLNITYLPVVEAGTVTAADGSYKFSSLANGTYNVRNNAKAGNFTTGPTPDTAVPPAANFGGGTHVVTIVGGADVSGKNFGQLEAKSIQGRVFEDRNGNGIYDASESALAGRQVFLDTNNNGKFDTGVQMGPTLFASTDVPVAIPDNNLAGVTSKNVIAGTGTIVDIDVSVNISHTWIGDLTITIIAPGGQSIVLYQPTGDPDGDDMIVTFDDESLNGVIPNTPPNATPPAYNLDYQPQNKLSGLDGLLADGEWKLKCSDSVNFDSGTINSWSLNITYLPVVETGTITATDGTYKFAGLAAGSYNVAEITPAGWNRLAPPGSVVAVLPANKAVTAFFTEARQNAIYGKTYFDANTSKSLDAGDTGLAGTKVYIDANGNNAYDVNPAVNFVGGGVPGVVPDASTIGLDLTTAVSGLTGFLADINVNFDASMTFDGDITAFLTSPTGVKITLFAQVGGGGDNFTGTTLDDQAAVAINAAVAPFSGSFKPAPGALSAFNGLSGTDLNGTWTLRLVDAFGGDIMTVNSWSLDIATGENATFSNADGNYAFTGLAPGTFDVRSVDPTSLISNSDPAGGKYSVTLPANGTVLNRDFGYIPDPRPVAVGSGAKVGQPSAGGSSTTVTVVYTDNYNTVIDASSIGTDDIRVKAPNGTFLLPTAFVATPNTNAKTISVDYTIPALGGVWDNTDNGIYSIETIAGKVFDQDTIVTVLGAGPYSVQAGKVGSFIVGLDTTYVVGLDGSVDDGITTTPAQTTVVEALRLANADFGNTTITFSIPTGSATLGGEVFVNQDLAVVGPAGGFTLNAAAGKRLFNIDIEGSVVVFSNLTLTGGDAGAGNGGAFLAKDENVTLNNVTVTANKATNGSSIAFSGSGGSLTLNGSTISNNTATAGGTIFFNGTTDFSMQKSVVTGNNAANIVGIWFNAFTGGSVNIGDSTISNNTGTSFSGGALYFSGTVGAKGAKINNSVISGNTNNFGGFLGLLFVDGKFEVSNSRIENNTSKFSGGAVIAAYGNTALDIINTSISGNKALNGSGGGIAAFSALDLTIIHSTIANNEATGSGGGIFMSGGGSLVVESSTISGNKANTSGTALGGGGIFFGGTASKFEINNSTISGNIATGTDTTTMTPTGYGGGILLNYFSGSPVIRNSTIVFNDAGKSGGGISSTASAFEISSSIIAKNTIAGVNAATGDLFSSSTVTVTVTGEFNIIGINDPTTNMTFTGFQQQGTLLVPKDPLLGALALNGAPAGSPLTHKPLPGSIAIDQGKNGASFVNDARGGKRTYDDAAIANPAGGDGTDVGAVEIQAAPTVVVLTNGQVSGQHSRVTSFVVTFDQPVTITNPSTAFTIFRTSGIGSDTTTGNVGYDVAGLDAMNQATTVTITFNDSGAIDPEFGSLRDGKYSVTVNGVGGVTGLDTAMTTNPVTNTWRLFGDGNGDGMVTAADFNSFRLFYGSSGNPLANLYDFDNNGSITASDFNQFRTRYGVSI